MPHLGSSTNRGRFDKKTGTVQLDKTGRSARVDITIETASISTGTTAFDQHLRGKDFFNSADFPTARFVADNFRFDGDKVAEVRGNLMLLGNTLPVQLKATRFACTMHPVLKVEVCGGDFETAIQRSQWGMSWGLTFGISANVRLVVQVEGLKPT